MEKKKFHHFGKRERKSKKMNELMFCLSDHSGEASFPDAQSLQDNAQTLFSGKKGVKQDKERHIHSLIDRLIDELIQSFIR